MNNKSVIKKLAVLGAFLAIIQINSVSAHDINGEYLYSGDSAADTWKVSCLNGSARLVARVRDLSSGVSKISAMIYKDGRAANTVDSVGGNIGYSPFVSVNEGDGVYMIIITNSQSSATAGGYNQYDINYHCESDNGNHTDTTVPESPIQDELS